MSRKESVWSISSVVACGIVAGAALLLIRQADGRPEAAPKHGPAAAKAPDAPVMAKAPVTAVPAMHTDYTFENDRTIEPLIADTPPNTIEWYRKNWKKPAADAAPTEACFAPGTSQEIMDFVNQSLGLESGNSGERYNLTTRWSGTTGSNRVLYWSFAPDGVSIPGGAGEPTSPNVLFANMDAEFASFGGRAGWINRFQQVFDRWAAVGGTTYIRVTTGGNDWDDGAAWGTAGDGVNRGDCRIFSHNIDGALNILAYDPFPPVGDMVLDSSENWAQGLSAAQHRFLRNTVAHEHGHGIGLLHVCPLLNLKLMEPQLSTILDGPRHDDIRAQHRHYGDDWEDNNTAAQASNIGLLETGAPITVGTLPPILAGNQPPSTSILSIDANGEEDWFRFSVAGKRVVTVTVTPQGTTYDSSVQSSASCGANPASCCSGNNINSLTMANLAVQLRASDGVTVLATADAQPSGTAESIASFTINTAGNYYVRVYETDNPTESQLYLLNLTAACPSPAPGIAPLANAIAVCGTSFTGPTPVADGNEQFAYSLGGSPPPGMTINPTTGVVSWPTTVASPTPYTITVQSNGPCGSDSESYSLTVAAGDLTGDGLVTEADTGPFVDVLLGLSGPICAADMNGDGIVDALDLMILVDLLI